MRPLPTRLRSGLGSLGSSLVAFGCTLLVVTAAKIAIAEPYYVPSGSMQPTLLIGDELLATKYAYGYGTASLPSSMQLSNTGRILGALPERGDVVVFRWPGKRGENGVKRVVGLPGDRIAMEDGRLWINGRAVGIKPDGIDQAESENGATAPARRYIETLPGGREHPILRLRSVGFVDSMPETVVPPDRLFLMGDNRDNSLDSRFPVSEGGVGMLPVANLVGRADALLGSWDLGVSSQPLWTWPQGLRLSRFFRAIR